MEITDQNFEQEVVRSNTPVLVDFFAEWCGPCKVQAPIIDELAKEYEGVAKIVKLDVDKNPKVASEHQIMSIPTLVLFHKGKVIESLTGLQQKNSLKEKLDKLIK